MSSQQIFNNHNDNLKKGLIDNELPEAYFSVYPNDEVFNTPLSELDVNYEIVKPKE